jgi:ankyrin repeat protein
VPISMHKEGCNPIHAACLYRHESIVKLLLDHGCAINDDGNSTTLHLACNESYTYYVAELLTFHEADVTTQRRGGDTALHIAYVKGST